MLAVDDPVRRPEAPPCFLCEGQGPRAAGRGFRAAPGGWAEAIVRTAPAHEGHRGLVHGGILAALLDEALGRAVTVYEPGRVMVTAELKVTYLAPVALGAELRVRGRLREDRRFLARGECEIWQRDVLMARAEGLLARPNPRR